MRYRTLVVVSLLAIGCHKGDSRSVLLPASAVACTPETYLLDLPPEGGFILNAERRDSAGVARWASDVLPQRSAAGRRVIVRTDSARQADLKWLVPAIQTAGGEAYEYDPACQLQIPASSG
jgi:hypothetical protein